MSAAKQQVLCVFCSLPLDPAVEEEVCLNSRKHQVCWRAYDVEEKAKRERVRLQRVEAFVRQHAGAALAELPKWEHADITSPLFAEKCRSAKLRKLAERWEPQHGSCALFGRSGLGKTTVMIAIHRRFVQAGIAAGATSDEHGFVCVASRELRFATCMKWIDAAGIVLARRTHPLGEGDPPPIVAAKRATILFIDEIGPESADRDGDLFGVIDYRDKANKPTLVTSGLTSAEFIQKYGDAMLRRLTERGVLIEEF